MAYRLGGGRSILTPTDGLTVEVQDIVAWPLYHEAVARATAYFTASGPELELAALRRAYAFFCAEAQPTWEIVDHRGIVPATTAGMLRLPVELGLGIILLWSQAFVAEPPETAVDKIIPPGELRDSLNRRLRAA
jgi:hypothetical protein